MTTDKPSRTYLSVLKILSGLFWTCTYILIINRGFQDQTFGMPVVALWANVSWEFIFSFIHPHRKPQRYVNLTWFLFDLVILGQMLWVGPTSLAWSGLSPALFYPIFLLGLLMAFWLILLITRKFEDRQGKYTAFGQNFIMSLLFITMLLSRGDVSGQSIYIALFKLIGSVIPSLALYRYYRPSKLINFLGLSIFIFDVIYLLLVYQKSVELGLNPWLRF